MSIRVMSKIWETSKQKGNRLLMLLAIGDIASDEGWAYPSQGTLAAKVRVTRRAAQRLIDILEKEGELSVYNRVASEGSHFTNLYHLAKYGVPDSSPPEDLRGSVRRRAARGQAQGSDRSVTRVVTGESPGSDPPVTRVVTGGSHESLLEPSLESSNDSFRTSSDQTSSDSTATIETTASASATSVSQPKGKCAGESVQAQDQGTASGTDISALIHAWLTAQGAIQPRAYANKSNRETAAALHAAGITPADVSAYIQDRKQDAFWRDKFVRLDRVASEIAGWLAAREEELIDPATLLWQPTHSAPGQYFEQVQESLSLLEQLLGDDDHANQHP